VTAFAWSMHICQNGKFNKTCQELLKLWCFIWGFFRTLKGLIMKWIQYLYYTSLYYMYFDNEISSLILLFSQNSNLFPLLDLSLPIDISHILSKYSFKSIRDEKWPRHNSSSSAISKVNNVISISAGQYSTLKILQKTLAVTCTSYTYSFLHTKNLVCKLNGVTCGKYKGIVIFPDSDFNSYI